MIIWNRTVLYGIPLLEENVLYRTLKGSISATYLEPLKGSIQNPMLHIYKINFQKMIFFYSSF